MITNPEHATKDRLKTELKRAGVPFEGNENKDYYVKLYRTHIMRAKGKGKAHRSEFSSDEEFASKVKGSPKRSVKSPKTAKPDTYMAQVAKLSDQELMEELQQYGENPGPITATTRALYDKMLARRMAEKTKVSSSSRRAQVQTQDSYIAEWSSGSEEEDSGEQIPRVSPVRISTPQVSEPRRVSTRSQTRLQASQSKTQSESTFVRERLPHRPERVEKEIVPKSHAQEAMSEIISLAINCSLLIVVALIAYLVYHYIYGNNTENLVVQAYHWVFEYVTHSWVRVYKWIVQQLDTPTDAPPTQAQSTQAV